MADLACAGAELRAAFESWLGDLAAGVPDAGELLDGLGALEEEVARVAALEAEGLLLERLLTAGFLPEPGAVRQGAETAAGAGGTHGGDVRDGVSREGGSVERAGPVGRESRADGPGPVGGGAAGGERPAGSAGPVDRSGPVDLEGPAGRGATPGGHDAVGGPAVAGPRGALDGEETVHGRPPDASRRPALPPRPTLGYGPEDPPRRESHGAPLSTPPAVRPIRGLGDLAALAGSAGIELAADAEDARRGAGGGAWTDRPPHAAPGRALAPDPTPRPRRTGDPHGSGAARGPAADADGSAGVGRTPAPGAPRTLRIPFLRHPVEAEETGSGSLERPPIEEARPAAPGTPAPPSIANPGPPGAGGAAARAEPLPAQTTRREWEGLHVSTDPTAFLALAARIARPRTATTAEPAWPAPAAPGPIPAASAATRTPAPAPTPSGAVDVAELMDALADEIAREYRRHYGD